MTCNTWVVTLTKNSARAFALDASCTSLKLVKELSFPAAKAEDRIIHEVASYIDYQAERNQFKKFVLATDIRLSALICAKLSLQTCTKFVGTVHLDEGDTALLYQRVMRLYGNEIDSA